MTLYHYMFFLVSYSHEKENFKSLLMFKVYKIASTPIIPAFFTKRFENTLVEFLYFQRSESTRYTPGIEPEAETIIPRCLFRLGLRFHRRKENATREDIRCGMKHAHIALSSSFFTNCMHMDLQQKYWMPFPIQLFMHLSRLRLAELDLGRALNFAIAGHFVKSVTSNCAGLGSTDIGLYPGCYLHYIVRSTVLRQGIVLLR